MGLHHAPSHGGGVLEELARLGRIAVPLWLQNSAQMGLNLIAVAAVGRRGDPLSLSQVVMASSLFNITGASLVSGLSAGLETFLGQAVGAGSYHTMGATLQRALLICLAACAPVTLLWAHIGPIIEALGQPAAIAHGAADYLAAAAPALWIMAVTECLKRYLLAQRVVLPGTLTAAATTAAAPFIYHYTMSRAPRVLDGAAAGFVTCSALSGGLLAAYVAYRDWSRRGRADATWRGLQPRAALSGWGAYLALAVPAFLGIAAEWLAYEVVIFAAGLLHDAEVAVGVMGLAFQISAAAYMSAMSLAAAANTRVANELGAGAFAAARGACWVAAGATLLSQAALTAAALAGAAPLSRWLAADANVSALLLSVMPILAATFIGDGINAVMQGALRGSGRQVLGAALNLVSYWLWGVPTAFLLGFKFHMGVRGFWLALLVTTTGQALLQTCVLARFDWRREAERAAELIAAGDAADGVTSEQQRCGTAAGSGAAAGAGGATVKSAAAAWDVEAGDDSDGDGVSGGRERMPLLLDTARSMSRHGSLVGPTASGNFAPPPWLAGSFSEASELGRRLRESSSLELPDLRLASASGGGGGAADASPGGASPTADQRSGGGESDGVGGSKGGGSGGRGARVAATKGDTAPRDQSRLRHCTRPSLDAAERSDEHSGGGDERSGGGEGDR